MSASRAAATGATPRRTPEPSPRSSDEGSVAAAEAPLRGRALLALFFASGVLTLVYQVLWVRELGLLFGSGAHASAATLAVFFLGLAIGSEVFGRRVADPRDALRVYAFLELGIAAAAALCFGLIAAYDRLLPTVASLLGRGPMASVGLRLAVSFAALLPASICMGGTLPALSQALIARRSELPRSGALLYAVNTFGAAAGALAAGFWLPLFPGVRATYLAAMAGNVAIGLLALRLGRTQGWVPAPLPRDPALGAVTPEPGDLRESTAAPPFGPRALTLAAFLSGFATLALEVLWTRMFALVLHNSVYSFTAILVGLLTALAIGAAWTARLASRSRAPLATFALLLGLAGISVALSPFVFTAWTGELGYLRGGPGFARYLGSVFAAVAVTLLPAAIACGCVLPFLLRLTPAAVTTGRAFDPGARPTPSAGAVVGRLTALNTLGGVAGALVGGFVLLPVVGLWGGIRAIAFLYLLGALVIAAARAWWRLCIGLAAACVLFTTVLDPARLPVLRLDRSGAESLHRLWETPFGTVAVTQKGEDRRIRLDNSYTLGGVTSRDLEAVQADLPLTIAGAPRSAFFLGLGTGITAGAALAHPLERLTTVELIPEVAEAARLYFEPWTNGLFEDARARVVIGDGRAFLRTTSERFDVIVSDLFVPWHAGTGSLYSAEHFAVVRTRLSPGGLFAQWLPLYQVSERELRIVARTMMEVFPQVTLWRGDFLPMQPIVALVGQEAGERLEPRRLLGAVRALDRLGHQPDDAVLALTLLFYAGNLSAARDLFEEMPVHRDDRPVLEHLAAMTQAAAIGGDRPWLVGAKLARFYSDLATRVPPEHDPYLTLLGETELGYVRAGEDLFRALVARRRGRSEELRAARDEFDRRVPYGVYEMFRNRLADVDPRASS